MDIQCHACIGGTNVRADLAKLEMGQHIVVGTPGRVHDMINRKALGELTHPYLELFGNSSDLIMELFLMSEVLANLSTRLLL